MAAKSTKQAPKSASTAQVPSEIMALQDAGFGNVMHISTAWLEQFSDMGAEVLGFVADRIKEDVKTQHEILHCKSVADLRHIQFEYFQRAMDQYKAETGKLVEMSQRTFVPRPQEAPAMVKAHVG